MKSGKILIVSLAAVLCVFLSACSCTNQEADHIKEPIPTTTATVEPTVEPTETPAPAKTNPGSGTTKKPSSGSSTKNNGGSSSGSNVNITTPTPVTPNVDVPENTPTPPRRSSSSNLRVD